MSDVIRLAEVDVNVDGVHEVFATPADAKWALKHVRNRKPSKHKVALLLDQMKKKAWIDSHDDPIMFDVRGNLVNGQHRMMALAQMPDSYEVIVKVRTMTSEERVAATDGVRPRSVRDNLGILYNKKIGTFELAAVAVWDYEQKTMSATRRQVGLTVEEYLDVAQRFPDPVQLLQKIGKVRRPGVRVAGVGTAVLVASEFDLTSAQEFFLGLIDPSSSILQAQFLFRTLMEPRRFAFTQGYDEQFLRYKYALTAFEAYRTNQPLTRWGKLLETLS